MAAFRFEDLETYQAARAFKKRIYRLADLLPLDEEKYRLRHQMRKAALTMTNCIAEGYARYTYKDRIRFIVDARASVCELMDDANDCEDNKYFKPEHLADLREDAQSLLRLMNGYIRYMRRQIKEGKKQPPVDETAD